MEQFTPVVIQKSEMLEAINRSEVDIQISTAKRFPRDVEKCLKNIQSLATLTDDIAGDCFYALQRDGQLIEGVSVRLAEIMATQWGNMRIQSFIIGNDGKKITARAMCHDLETNLAVSVDVDRRITKRDGKTYSDDMQIVTGNAASSIAFRNAVLKVIPKALTGKIVEDIKQVALGKAIDLETSRANMLTNFKRLTVTQEEILSYLKIKSVNDIDREKLLHMKGLFQALKEGTTTVEETFRPKIEPMAKIDPAHAEQPAATPPEESKTVNPADISQTPPPSSEKPKVGPGRPTK